MTLPAVIALVGNWRTVALSAAAATLIGTAAWVVHLHGRVGDLQRVAAEAQADAKASAAAVTELREQAKRQVAAIQAVQADAARIASASGRVRQEISHVPDAALSADALRALRLLSDTYRAAAAPAGARQSVALR